MTDSYDDYKNSHFLGRGWSFPPAFDVHTGESLMVADARDIEQSLIILLSTSPGERVMEPTFGCDLKSMMFSIIDGTTIARIKYLVKNAVLFFESRVTLHEVEIDIEDAMAGILRIKLDYSIISINTRSNLVYPFYFEEATNAGF
ncbi:MAG: phage baseplate assembly protein W [Phenylobacterium sp.]|jgi:phage baseplate assembly protein W